MPRKAGQYVGTRPKGALYVEPFRWRLKVSPVLGVTTIQTSPYQTPLCGVDDVSGCTFQAAFTAKIQGWGLQFWAIFLTIAYQCVEKDKLNLWDTCALVRESPNSCATRILEVP